MSKEETAIAQETTNVAVQDLRKLLQQYNEDLGIYINSDERYRLGQVLTIIDASISDKEQRKAVKDLINNGWWGGFTGTRDRDGVKMSSPHEDIRALCESLGFALYENNELLTAEPAYNTAREWQVKRYTDVLKTR